MRFPKHFGVLAVAALAFWAPSAIGGGDAAYAHSHGVSPWPAVYVFASAGSVIVNSVYVWNTQCRELSSREAVTSAALPLIGIVFDEQASKCRR